MKYPIVILSSFIFLFCILILGVRGLPGAVIAVLTFVGGFKVGQKEAAVSAYVEGLTAKIKSQWQRMFP